MLEHQGEQVDDDQVADPLVQFFLEVAGDVGVEQPGVKPLAHRQVAVDVGFYVLAQNGFDVEVF